jgi:hypothetical protein
MDFQNKKHGSYMNTATNKRYCCDQCIDHKSFSKVGRSRYCVKKQIFNLCWNTSKSFISALIIQSMLNDPSTDVAKSEKTIQ